MWPFTKYDRLIEALYEELNHLKEHVLELEKEREFAKALKKLKSDIEGSIAKGMALEKVSKTVVIEVIKELKKERVGLV